MIRLQSEPIDVGALLSTVGTDASGAIDIFVGTTRNNADGKIVSSLEYEAYEGMAEKELANIVQEARSRWPVNDVAVVHRLGRVPVGEASVAIAVSSSHRLEAFNACKFIIDTLKERVPIWKRETFADGTVEWSGSEFKVRSEHQPNRWRPS